jgi:hypothetical protein
MTFDVVLTQVRELLQRQGRVSYRALKLRFGIDDNYIEELKDELIGMRPLQAHCHRGLGTLYSQTGQAEQARAELSAAIDMYRDMAMTFWLPETEAALVAVEKR